MSTHSQSKPAWASSWAVKPVGITHQAPKDGFFAETNVDRSLVVMPYLLTPADESGGRWNGRLRFERGGHRPQVCGRKQTEALGRRPAVRSVGAEKITVTRELVVVGTVVNERHRRFEPAVA